MRLFNHRQTHSQRRGAALLLSVMVLFVLIAIVFQISIGTMTDARIGRNDVGLTLMDRAIASAQWDVMEMLKLDGEEAESGAADPAQEAMAAAQPGEGEEAPTDSRKDEWATPQRTEINRIELRVFVEPENAKYNVLNILNEDEEESEEALQRVVRVIDLYREGTTEDVEKRQAEEMVREMKEFMSERHRTDWPKANLLTVDEEDEGLFMPFSLRDFLVLESWEPHMFRSYRDEYDVRVHGLGQFLTVWSSPGTVTDQENREPSDGNNDSPAEPEADAEGEEGVDPTGDSPETGSDPQQPQGQDQGASDTGASSAGYGVNLNLAPAAVLHSLFDSRIVNGRFWDDVIEYRNLEEEDEDGETSDEEPLYDEFNNEILDRRIFESLDELSEVRSWDNLDSESQSLILSMLETQSSVFTVYITARRDMSSNLASEFADPREKARMEEEPSGALVRTVRSVVWRRTGDDGIEIIPIIPWEVIGYVPQEVEDYPEDSY